MADTAPFPPSAAIRLSPSLTSGPNRARGQHGRTGKQHPGAHATGARFTRASVESAISTDHAAGGAPPEPPDRVVRFGAARLRHRGRA